MPKLHRWLRCTVPWRTALQHKQMPHYDVNFWHQQLVIMLTVSFFLWNVLGNGAVTYPLRSIKQPLGASLYFSHNFHWKVLNNFLSLSPAHTHLRYPHTLWISSYNTKDFSFPHELQFLRCSFSCPNRLWELVPVS